MTKLTRVKICGITREEDALAACELGADALGFVFYPKSPRAIELDRFQTIATKVPPFVTIVGLFVNPSAEQVQGVIDTQLCDLLQFHGDEDEAFCSQFSFPYIKAIRVKNEQAIVDGEKAFPSAKGLLFDAYDEALFGGTGKQFDWSLLAKMKSQVVKPVIVAGGLTADNVAESIQHLMPWAVDVSGGVEAEQDGKQLKGIKSREKISAFISEVKGV